MAPNIAYSTPITQISLLLAVPAGYTPAPGPLNVLFLLLEVLFPGKAEWLYHFLQVILKHQVSGRPTLSISFKILVGTPKQTISLSSCFIFLQNTSSHFIYYVFYIFVYSLSLFLLRSISSTGAGIFVRLTLQHPAPAFHLCLQCLELCLAQNKCRGHCY